MMSPSESFSLGMHYNNQSSASAYFQVPQSPGNQTMPHFGQSHASLPAQQVQQSNYQHHRHHHELLQNEQVGRFQGLDIGTKGSSSVVKSEGPSLSASESSWNRWLTTLFIDWHPIIYIERKRERLPLFISFIYSICVELIIDYLFLGPVFLFLLVFICSSWEFLC